MARVLIVDDSPIVTKLIEANLGMHGFQVAVSNTSFGVSAKMREFRPDVLLMDLGIPGLSGEALLGTLRESGLTCHTIIISSAPEEELKNHVRNGLANDYYIKGTPLDLLVTKIARKVKATPPRPTPGTGAVSPAPAPPTPRPAATGVGPTAITWQESLRTGFATIDTHHKEIFARFNDLLNACSAGKGREEVVKYLRFLRDYITFHFAEEEGIQVKYAYPDYERHRLEHARFAQDLASLEQLLAQEGATLALIIQANKLSIDWLLRHISGSDRALAEFLSTRGLKGI